MFPPFLFQKLYEKHKKYQEISEITISKFLSQLIIISHHYKKFTH
ncbi:hypothetical protein CSE_15470 [Caldisericum exile AZM16c01]|uniref:Uncharacterized protein n=1 Tax=Caldisericum exile (strain DSM 21853 / NBRC 104410 / AZM16c01) TaxID=511051 RepID=A0A7U6GFX3_CALEA|nr:hypothetical protein CSE_15470 [Caldisericum exile AZM16c01]